VHASARAERLKSMPRRACSRLGDRSHRYRLINGIDYKGRICGVTKGRVDDKPKLYYLTSGYGVCVKKCPKSTNPEKFYCHDNAQDDLASYDKSDATEYAQYVSQGYKYVKDEKCAIAYETLDIIGYCITAAGIDVAEEVANSAAATAAVSDAYSYSYSYVYDTGADDQEKSFKEKFFGDIWVARWFIFGFGFFGAIFVGFCYTFLLRIPGVLTLIVWSLLFSIFFLFLLLGALCFSTAARWQEEEEDGERDQNQVDGMQYLAYFFIAVAFVWLCLLICVRKRAAA